MEPGIDLLGVGRGIHQARLGKAEETGDKDGASGQPMSPAAAQEAVSREISSWANSMRSV